ncbi:MAG TPA: sigma-70 family RNA polymerase sigma factor [Terracidiphilus sp.]|jgi:RNA polymerase sigma-70 factor (ECF subfamily)|nr:sigma-70 family RNA polymerase sigma factor [Terracidiphilus sp.]
MEINLSDAEIVLRIGNGRDPEAEAELCKRMGPRARLYGLRHLRDRHAAEDLVQQVLIQTLLALREGRLREPEKLASFVLGMCRMTIMDQRRNAQRRAKLLEQFGGDVPMAGQTPGPRLDDEKLARCVQGLKERERAVVVMTFYDEQTGADVAHFLDVSEMNARVIRHRAIQQLRDCLGVAR